ncbi:MAG: class I SAM-dependent methyltransferase [Spirochaetes bacterium]|nr:class I SAM-dependent methyltransferase [Spirochaetota bacterium]
MPLYKIIEQAVLKREALFNNAETNAFRLFNSSGDNCEGLIIDYYNGYVLLQLYDSSLYSIYHKISKYCKTILNSLHIPVNGILLKDRSKVNDPQRIAQIRKSILVEGDLPPEKFIVKQNNIAAYVDLINGQNTGVFLDMRVVRSKMAAYYMKGGNLCNLFCYTGLFSVHALKNGVQHAVNVDISQSVLNRAKQNYLLNNIAYDSRDFVKIDCKQYLKKALKHNTPFNFVIFDPPTFSRNKKQNFSVKTHYSDFCALIQTIARSGYVLTTINAVSISVHDYRSLHPKDWKLEFLDHEPDDFPYIKPYLKAGLWKIP